MIAIENVLTTSQIVVLLCVLAVVILGWMIIMYRQNSGQDLRSAFKKSRAKDYHNVKTGEYVRLHGRVLAIKEPLIAPLSGRSCMGYEVYVNGVNFKGVKKVVQDQVISPFNITSGSDLARIVPTSKGTVKFELQADFTSTKKDHEFPKSALKAFLKDHQVELKSETLDHQQFFSYREAIIALEERIVVKGIALWKTDPKTQKRYLEITGTYDNPILISDMPGNLRTLPKSVK